VIFLVYSPTGLLISISLGKILEESEQMREGKADMRGKASF
jgi:hypothetical protein